MKVTYMERIENKLALVRDKFCTCGEHEYQIIEQLEPQTEFKWSVRCPYCGRETGQYSLKQGAVAAWRAFKD